MAALLRARWAPMLRAVHRSAYATSIREPTVVGLSYDPNSRETLLGLYKQTLEAVSTLPEDAAYRKNVTSITEYRMQVVTAEEDIATIESKLGVGQIEEVIEQAQDELELIPHMAEWKPWALAEGQKPVKIEVID